MSRSVPEWIGKTDDAKPHKAVRLRRFDHYQGRCADCGRKIGAGALSWDLDHIKSLREGGENRETNLQPLCEEVCHEDKTSREATQRAKEYRKREAHVLGTRPSNHKLPRRGFQKAAPQRSASRPIVRRNQQET